MNHDGVAVRRCAGNCRLAYRATGATPLINDERLPHAGSHFVGNGARNDVCGAACGKRHDYADGFVGVGGLCSQYQWGKTGQSNKRGATVKFYDVSKLEVCIC